MRRAQIDLLTFTGRSRTIHTLLEVDVTRPRGRIRALRAAGDGLSFTAYVVACVARAVDEHRLLHAYRQGARHLVVFDEVDVSTQIERERDGQKIVVPLVVRAAHGKSAREIHDELRAAQTRGEEVAGQFAHLRWYLRLPRPVRRALWATLQRFPVAWKRLGGTVGAGWGVPVSPVPLLVTLGGIAEKPWVVAGRIEIREVLCLTLSVDHDIVDGAPAARFARRLTGLIESGDGIETAPGRPQDSSITSR